MSEAMPLTSADFDPAAALDVAHRRHMLTLIHKNGPSANTRASSIGLDCERALYYERTVAAEDRVAHQPELQAIFELGKDFERIAIRRLEDMGAEIIQRGRDYIDQKYQLSGHTDLKLRMPGWPRAVTGEVKGLNPYTGEAIHTLADIRDSRVHWIRKYFAQLQAYLFLAGEDLGVFILVNKSTGWPRFINCPLDREFVERELLPKAERIRSAVAAESPPPRNQSKECTRCQFFTTCSPDVSFGPGVTMLDNPELEALVARRAELEDAHREYEAVDKELKSALPEAEEVLLGDFVITGKLIDRRAYSVKAGSYWKRDVRRLSTK